jgi:hypothetical protein
MSHNIICENKSTSSIIFEGSIYIPMKSDLRRGEGYIHHPVSCPSTRMRQIKGSVMVTSIYSPTSTGRLDPCLIQQTICALGIFLVRESSTANTSVYRIITWTQLATSWKENIFYSGQQIMIINYCWILILLGTLARISGSSTEIIYVSWLYIWEILFDMDYTPWEPVWHG